MRIIVFVKQVPDADTVRFDPVTGNLDREGVSSVMNPPDAHAIEAAVRLKEQYGGQVTAVSMGPPQAESVLKKALAMGCDDAVLLSDRAFGGADTLATGYVLAQAAAKLGSFDLLLCGKNSSDAETAQTGSVIAEFLDIAQVTLVDDISIQDGSAVCRRLLSDAVQTVRVKLPALIAVLPEMNKPRYPNAISITRALKKPRQTWGLTELGCEASRAGAAGSPSINKRLYTPVRRSVDTRYFGGDTEEMARAFTDMLEEHHLIRERGI